MAINVKSVCIEGIGGQRIQVEVEVSKGLTAFNIVGLGSTEVKEAKDRVRAAIENSNLNFPAGRVTVNLAPADVRKEGTLFDLPIAVALLCIEYGISIEGVESDIIFGELSLNGDIRSIKGAFTLTKSLSEIGEKKFIIPYGNLKECLTIEGIEIYPFTTLREVFMYIKYRDMKGIKSRKPTEKFDMDYDVDMNEVIGNEYGKRALEVAAAGKHNILILGPPGCGKSMLASRLYTILPKLTYKESLEVTSIYSAVGKMSKEGLMKKRPFRAPHNSITKLGLIGGGRNLSPGEITLAHKGVLFIDEFLELERGKIETLRQPIEDKKIQINKNLKYIEYPCDFIFIATSNLCPCGYSGGDDSECKCSLSQINKYRSKLSGPIMDRFDLIIFLSNKLKNIGENSIKGDASKIIQKRIEKAWEVQKKRYKNDQFNSSASMKLLKKNHVVSDELIAYLCDVCKKIKITNRGFVKILKIARTIADLEGSEEIEYSHISEAINYRQGIYSIVK
ncbi:YifB family Mg chelatase-like AAA ATPase [Oceanirhabdus sp. W0125-5]|uniref:YifB family Mg chelatase-like AAA ATPase n=1 Tax=Oceanirhabdus sp. W0125-5 TaxID=2999116 RepID=UPI0022F2E0F1|nr:YifB family Mg chelatase-like AAA ATPase [Oceanirhabdus sp. W0125-5]WBW94817.1 YifB family Mg chelatase-like AAA ATPase [Oceanirhabdus sp. W0125-5]